LYNYAVSNNDAKYIEFIGDNAEGGVLNNINTKIEKYNWKSYKVKNIKMKELLQESNFKYIDFMIIDVEGSELSLLQSINFEFPIFCIIIEAHSNEPEKNKMFGDFLKSNGFTFKERQRGNEIWLNLNYFRKHLFNN
jgi:mRNA-degrading endonuclease HigB of HigAB toxin-antitoxin module